MKLAAICLIVMTSSFAAISAFFTIAATFVLYDPKTAWASFIGILFFSALAGISWALLKDLGES